MQQNNEDSVLKQEEGMAPQSMAAVNGPQQEEEGEEAHVHGPHCQHSHAHGPLRPIKRSEPKVGRNEPCPCGSGKKFKKCHGL